jgi:16S rRNA (uracil1498-N3)-methyltransferase
VTDIFAPLVSKATLALSATFKFDKALADGLRTREVRPKEAFTVQCGISGLWFRAALATLHADGGDALAYERLAASPEPSLQLTLVCAVLGRQRMLPVAQKAAELGCYSVLPALTEHSVQTAELDKEKPWAWQGQALKGTRQCRRGRVPKVSAPVALEKIVENAEVTSAQQIWVLDDVAWGDAKPLQARPLATMPQGDKPRAIVLAVGPEGGWSQAERALWQAHGAAPLRIGPRVLRAETAVFAGLSILQYRFGDFSA